MCVATCVSQHAYNASQLRTVLKRSIISTTPCLYIDGGETVMLARKCSAAGETLNFEIPADDKLSITCCIDVA